MNNEDVMNGVGRNATSRGRIPIKVDALVDDNRVLIALSRHCGTVHNTQTVASTIQDGHYLTQSFPVHECICNGS